MFVAGREILKLRLNKQTKNTGKFLNRAQTAKILPGVYLFQLSLSDITCPDLTM